MIDDNIEGFRKAKEIAISKGGRLLSEVCNSSQEKLEWECAKKHIFESSYNTINQDCWCKSCSYEEKRTPIETLRQFAINKGGKLISDNYINGKEKLIWECKRKHRWDAIWTNVNLKDRWCPDCSGNRRKTIEQMKEIAIKNGGECLSNEYFNSHTHLTWKCRNEHVFTSRPAKVLLGRWCPHCHDSVGEQICLQIFEKLFDKQFLKIRPEWLINDNNQKMELDGYCEELSLAFEHQGDQHYKKTGWFPTEEKFAKRVNDDLKKIELCKERNINLIIIPQIFSRLPLNKAISFIKEECLKVNIIPKNDNIEIDFSTIHSGNNKIEIYRKIAKSKGGKCLSKRFIHCTIKLEFECEKGHKWFAFPRDIKKRWCKECKKKEKCQ